MEDKFRDDIVLLENILDRRSPPAELSLSFLKYITNDFSDERVAGRGGFGVVYKGEFKNRNVAVKKLTNYSDKTEHNFSREIDSLMHVNHKNIVHFLGYCNEIKSKRVDAVKTGKRQEFVYVQDRMLCFEYIGNGSLTGNIQDELRGLEWHTRYKIIKEICQALDYLHNKRKMVHRDLKPDNILLDNLMVPKVADLGLSKILDDGASKTITMTTASSLGYCDPEFKGGIVKYSYDIYSLGVIIIELVTGFKRPPDLQTVLTRWRHRWNKSNEILRYRQVAKCIEIGLLCKNSKVKNRPKISKIIKDLEDVDGGNGAVGQEIVCWNDLLWFEPPELFFPFEINKQMTCSVELKNESDDCMAFFIKQDGEVEYDMDPNKGIVQPRSHFTVSITMVAQEEEPEEMRNADEFTVMSKKVKESVTAEDITEDMFSKESPDVVYQVYIGVVFDAKLRAPCCIPREAEEAGESSKQSLRDLDKKVIDFPSKQDETEYTNSGTTSLPTKPGRVLIKSSHKAPLLNCNKRVMLEITGGDYTSDRPGLDLVVVLHVSANVYGNLRRMKTATRFVVRKLSPIDRLSVVTYSDAATKLCPLRQITDTSRKELLKLIDNIKTDSSMVTNITDGLLTGRKVLADRKVSDGRVAAIILVCDDHENKGKATEVSIGNVPVYTFAFYNETDPKSCYTVLSAVAANSMGGTFSVIQKVDYSEKNIQNGYIRSGGLTMAFSQCLAGLLTVTVQDLELTVSPNGDESRIVKVTAGSYPQKQLKDSGGSVTVSFGNLYSMELRKVIIDLELPAIESERSANVLKVTCSYSSRSSGSWQQFVAPPETLTLWRTGSMDDIEEEKPVELQMEESRLQTANIVKETRTSYDAHSRYAVNHYGKQVEAQNKLVEQSNPLFRTDLKYVLELFDPERNYARRWEGRPYALSLESSHGRQRFAARGDMEIMRLFATPRMDMYLEQAKTILPDEKIWLPSSLDDDGAEVITDLTINSWEEEIQRLSLNLED